MILSKKRALLFLWRSLYLEKALGVKAGLSHRPIPYIATAITLKIPSH
ncbi:MAG: hypothetical protein MGU50_18640 [Trichodesmium sp. MAG_R02]|nr:hypothetical protein [Trichodesmium sp. MAG_R02]